MGTLITFSH